MKKLFVLLIVAALCCSFSACKGDDPVDPTPTTPTAPINNAADVEQMHAAYSAALTELMTNYTLPDGTACDFEQSLDMSDNTFAIYDIDLDNSDELIIFYTTTFSAAMSGSVWGYDAETQQLRLELSAFPMLTFYSNGAVKAGWSHNQGLAGEFWPYNMYSYDAASDSYVLVAAVDAWDKNFVATDFPSDTDISGTGFVYYIMPDGQYDTSNPVDSSEYESWLNSVIGGADEVSIDYLSLTAENISRIG